LADVSRRLDDLTSLVEIGSRWAARMHEAEGRLPSESELPEIALRLERSDNGTLLFWAVADWRAVHTLAPPLTVSRVSYSNPLEVVLAGSVFILHGVTLAARLVRDWSATRRVNAAKAQEAEAEARMTDARADLYEWLVAQAKTQGGGAVPAEELVRMTTNADLKVLNRIAEDPVSVSEAAG